jgi:hypothetical protein
MHDRPVEPGEPLARYIFDSNRIRTSDNSVKHNAFMPNQKTGDLSVFRCLGLTEAETIQLGDAFVTPEIKRPMLGYAETGAAYFFNSGLTVQGTAEPDPRHANVANWPGMDKTRLVATYLAENSRLVLTGH